jgi:predicted RNase H-like nuclease (RuvC/YqgF family)
MAKILTIVTIFLATVAALVGFINRIKLVETKETLATTQAERDTTKKTLEETNVKLAQSQQSVSDWTAKTEAAQAEVNKLKSDIETKESETADAKGKLMAANVEIESLKSKVDSTTKLKDDIMQKFTDLQNEPVQQQLTEARTAIEEQKTINTELTANIDKSKLRIKDLEEQLAQKKRLEKIGALSGRVLAVNEAWNFVVLNIGDKDGISSNSELLVKRGNTRIGRIRITSVEPASSIADIIPGSLIGGLNIQPGDYVVSDYVTN